MKHGRLGAKLEHQGRETGMVGDSAGQHTRQVQTGWYAAHHVMITKGTFS